MRQSNWRKHPEFYYLHREAQSGNWDPKKWPKQAEMEIHFLVISSNQTLIQLCFREESPESSYISIPFTLPTAFYCFWERRILHVCVSQAGSEWEGREKIPSRLGTVITEPSVELKLTNREIMTWAEINSQLLNQMSHPGTALSPQQDPIFTWILINLNWALGFHTAFNPIAIVNVIIWADFKILYYIHKFLHAVVRPRYKYYFYPVPSS